MKKFCHLTLFSLLITFSVGAEAATGCVLALSYPGGEVLKQEGDCNQRRSPASTFKLPLALMGFDAGILADAHQPSLVYQPEYAALSKREEKTVDPSIWMEESIVWYSRFITGKLGEERFKDYIDRFGYGNTDISGGLAQAWLLSSLEISPREQAEFIKNFLNRDIGLSTAAYEMTEAIMPQFTTGEWKIFGKTGSGLLRGQDGTLDQNQPLGWFIGWAEKNDRKIIFVNLQIGDQPYQGFFGLKTRDDFLAGFPEWMIDAPSR